MISFAGQMHRSSVPEFSHWETGQFRMQVPPWDDMRQGVLFYNYARRAGKDAVLLRYPGEGHGLGKRENAIDYERRILQWCAHYLKGEAPPAWITDGQSWLQRKAIFDANK